VPTPSTDEKSVISEIGAGTGAPPLPENETALPSALKINICSTIVRAYQFEKNLPSAAERVKKNRIKGKRGRV
jgi:hypothetical protein